METGFMTDKRPTPAQADRSGPAATIKRAKPLATGAVVRRTARDDTTGATSATGIEKKVVRKKLDAAQGVQQNALKDILKHSVDKASALKALLAGSSPDDVAAIREMLLEDPQLTAGKNAKPDEELNRDWRSGAYPYKTLMSRKNYEAQKYKLQVELLKLQLWAKETGQRIVILFEGRDAAGKGGAIKRFMEHVNPRGARLVALEKPTDMERGQWYFQRYVQHLPTAGEIVM
jgi:hypothetical protein